MENQPENESQSGDDLGNDNELALQAGVLGNSADFADQNQALIERGQSIKGAGGKTINIKIDIMKGDGSADWWHRIPSPLDIRTETGVSIQELKTRIQVKFAPANPAAILSHLAKFFPIPVLNFHLPSRASISLRRRKFLASRLKKLTFVSTGSLCRTAASCATTCSIETGCWQRWRARRASRASIARSSS